MLTIAIKKNRNRVYTFQTCKVKNKTYYSIQKKTRKERGKAIRTTRLTGKNILV